MKRRSKHYQHPTLFISGNVARRIPLFRLWPEANKIFTDNFDFYRGKYGFQLRGYVLMPDHYHLLVTLKSGTALTALLRDFKSSVGRQIVDSLKRSNQTELLERFRLHAAPRRRKDPHHQILQYDNDIVEVFTPRILLGKLRYMHNNPVTKGLVVQPGEWEYSSWCAYELGQENPIRIDRIDGLSL